MTKTRTTTMTTEARSETSRVVAGRSAKQGPLPSRILAAAASVSAGIGLVVVMAGAQPEIVVQVNPTPIVVQPVDAISEMSTESGDGGETPVSFRLVEAAVPVDQLSTQARPVARSQGS